jgi:hypothetical protein
MILKKKSTSKYESIITPNRKDGVLEETLQITQSWNGQSKHEYSLVLKNTDSAFIRNIV